MNLSDFIEIDRQLYLDPGAGDPFQRLERDRRIGRALTIGQTSSSKDDEALLLDWKKEVTAAGGYSLGKLMEGAVRWTAFLLVVFGLLTGTGAAAALLRYDGTQPINVLFFLGAIVGPQLLLLPLLVLSFLFRDRLRHGFRLVRSFIGGVLTQVLLLLARFGISQEKALKLRADLGALRAGNSLYAAVQPVLVLLLAQLFGVAFNLAVAATLLFFVLFSDLTFSWGTTVQVEAEQIYEITSALSAPWAGVVPQARPSLELVETTRYIRLEGAFATPEPAALQAGGWWPFLLASTLTYGLLPRLLALVASLWILRSEMRQALARSSEVKALKERLRTPLVRVDADPVVEPVRKAEAEIREPHSRTVAKGLRLAAVFWAYDDPAPEGTVARLLQESLGATVASQLSAGGIQVGEEQVLTVLRQAKREDQIGGAAVFFEPFEPPKTDARRFLARLREALGPTAPVVIFLAEFVGGEIEPVEQGDWSAWDRAVRSMGDPYLLLSKREVLT